MLLFPSKLFEKVDTMDVSDLSTFLAMSDVTAVSEFKALVAGFPSWPSEFNPKLSRGTFWSAKCHGQVFSEYVF
jgi:hypothetical protein